MQADTLSFTNYYDMYELAIPLTKIVERGGSAMPGRASFELEILDPGWSNFEDSNIIYRSEIKTRGEGEFAGSLILTGPRQELQAMISEPFYVREVNRGALGWSYDEAVYAIAPYYANPPDVDTPANPDDYTYTPTAGIISLENLVGRNSEDYPLYIGIYQASPGENGGMYQYDSDGTTEIGRAHV